MSGSGNQPDSPAPVPQPPQTTTALKEKPATAPPKVDHLPPYKVILHNDDVNEAIYVVRTILELTPLSRERALTATMEADQTGLSMLLVTHKERAELYAEQFLSKSLTVTIEPAE